MGRAILAVSLAFSQRNFARQSLSLLDGAPGTDTAVKILRKDFGTQILGLRFSLPKINNKVGVLTRDMDGLKRNFFDLKEFSTKFEVLSEKVADLSTKFTTLSDKFPTLDKSVSIIKWQIGGVFVVAVALAGGVLWVGNKVWEFLAGDSGDVVRAVVRVGGLGAETSSTKEIDPSIYDEVEDHDYDDKENEVEDEEDGGEVGIAAERREGATQDSVTNSNHRAASGPS
ncbi:hypothetical protein B9Z19DRAFT_1068540 [Tuber borchii]|uniref:Uncharacterized protein n=1 Tax=Tuber borchii TaxID=42251 RepID=A0A2T6ZET7_TUBBO|nr:hypothetical protein B9Z19DRAFT_1068540 [Tuber borchii]